MLNQTLRWLLLISAVMSAACSSLPVDVKRNPSSAFLGGDDTMLGRAFSQDIAGHPGKSGIQVLDTGKDALQSRLALLATAEHAVDLQYYIWNSDFSGRLMAERVLRAADRGVRVRLLLDDFNVGDRDTPLAAVNAHPNVEVRIYNPNVGRRGMAKWFGLVSDFGRLNQRMHNKSFVVDGSVAIIGGRNIGDEYFDLHAELNFRDRDLIIVGPAVSEISRGFDDYWNSERSFPVDSVVSGKVDSFDARTLRDRLVTDLETQLSHEYPLPADRETGLAILDVWRSKMVWAQADLLIDPVLTLDQTGGETQKQVALELADIARGVDTEILIESAYLILGDDGLTLMNELNARGVTVSALTNSLASNDLTTNHAGYARRRMQMLESGMQLFELRPDAASCQRLVMSSWGCHEGMLFGLHAKSMVFDRKSVFVGSFNLNLRSVYLNSEVGLLIQSPELARRIAGDIEENMRPENSWQVRLDDHGRLSWGGNADKEQEHYFQEPEVGLWRRLLARFFALFPIEKYL